MAIHSMAFEDSVFYAVEEGVVTETDAVKWLEQLLRYAQNSPSPIIAMVDARNAKSVTRPAKQIFADAVFTPNLYVSCVVTDDPIFYQVSQSIGLRAKRGATHVFRTMDEAAQFIDAQLQHLGRQQFGRMSA